MEKIAPNMDFEIEWQGYRIEVAYQPNWLGSASQLAVAHFDITTIDPPRAPLPITENLPRTTPDGSKASL